jgi:hypothetical protein
MSLAGVSQRDRLFARRIVKGQARPPRGGFLGNSWLRTGIVPPMQPEMEPFLKPGELANPLRPACWYPDPDETVPAQNLAPFVATMPAQNGSLRDRPDRPEFIHAILYRRES